MLGLFGRKKTQITPDGPILASAALVPMGNSAALRKFLKPAPWQDESWGFHDNTPEIRFGISYKASSVSRARLCIAKIDADGQGDPEPVDETWSREFLAEFFKGQIGQQQMLARVTRQLEVAGESYIVGVDADDGRIWKVASANELEVGNDGVIRLQILPGEPPLSLDPQRSWVKRLWMPDAKIELKATSPMRALLPVLREFHKLSSKVNAETESRLAGPGVFIVPESATVMNPGGGEGNPIHPDQFVADFIESMITPIQDPDSAAAVVPAVIKARDESIDLFKHMTFSSPLDERTQEMRDACIRRIAIGLDMPYEILQGVGSVNHWGAWKIEESAIKLHIEPVLSLICTALTDEYVRPGLEQLGVPNADDYILWFDTSELTLRPDRGPEYITMYDRGIVSAEAARRENGASEEDAPTPEEELKRLLVNLITTNPELAPTLVPQLAGTLGVKTIDIASSTQDLPQLEAPKPAESTREEIPTPQDEEPPAMTAAATVEKAADWRLCVAEMAALRALERAGRWILAGAGKKYRRKLRNIRAWDMHLHLPKAQVCDEMFTEAYSTLQCAVPDVPCIGDAVDDYVRGLIATGTPHSRDKLAEALEVSGCIA